MLEKYWKKERKQMETKEKWTNDDFEEMGWHDSRLYQMKFPNEDYEFILYLDYIFKWEKPSTGKYFKFWVSPCELKFANVHDLKIDLSFENYLQIYIDDIRREKIGLTPNSKMTEWKFYIETDRGNIEFIATDFEMNLISQPVLKDGQDMSS